MREILRAIDWCEVVVCERDENRDLGRSILTGVSEVLDKHDSMIVFEDDLICVPGTYNYLSLALQHYVDDANVMSVTAWTHPRVTPREIANQPCFDGRAECLAWGTWPRHWVGMKDSAKALMMKCEQRGIDAFRYGEDLPEMAEQELKRNI